MTFSTMNKKFIFAGAILLTVAGFFTLTAFGGKTLEQQKQEIAAAVTARLEELRAQKEEECTAKVTEDGQRRYQEFLAAQPVLPAAKPGKKGKTSTPKVAPLPQTVPGDPQKQRPGASQPGNVEDQKKRSGATPPASGENAKPVDVQQQKKRPGAPGGGGSK